MARADNDDLINLMEEDQKQNPIPESMPLMPVRDVVIFTDMLLPLFIGRKKSVRALEEAFAKEGYLMLVTQKDQSVEDPTPDQLYKIGTVGRVLRMLKLPDGRVKALVQGVSKAKILAYSKAKALYRVKIKILKEDALDENDLEIEALMRNIREHSEKILTLRGEMSNDVSAVLGSIKDPSKLADLVASNLRLKVDESQKVLEILNPRDRLKKVNDMLMREMELSVVQAKIQSEVRDEISKHQRDYFLREQVRAINKELGDADDKSQEAGEYSKKIKRAKMSKAAEHEAKKQIRRLETMHPDSAETSIVRTYLDCLVEMPWSKSTKDVINIKEAKKILDNGHYGLDKVKDRILEYLSVKKLNPKSKGTILCFVGPPGVGKTSLGKSIAKSVKRKFVRISLGGVRDEAEIRGHRRTYIGALPGRILQSLRQCGVNNPVFMMDEIDKMSSDFRGDPSAALLEALDPEQNIEFSDHYLNLPFDLSKVMFILTANHTDSIPSALLDRMELIRLSGYTEEEKQKIAEKHLIPKQFKENGLKSKLVSISSDAMSRMIREYTSEAGLRNLEREIATLCRKIARKLSEDEKGPFAVNAENLEQYLGIPKYLPDMDQEESQIGLATGLAWTQAGGDVLYVEAGLIRGKGELIITGQIGDVMHESAQAALSYVKANFSRLGIEDNILEKNDIHIHVPAGAIPKDGPSAGIAMATSLISLLTKKPISKYVAMTGEITLRGRVLPIGGLKEKALGALRGGIRTIIIPEKNKKDLSDIPENITKQLKFVLVKQMDEVLDIAFEQTMKP